jgi:hypothetical protein
MVSDFDICPHCKTKGNSGIMMRLNQDTPLITRSDGRAITCCYSMGRAFGKYPFFR